MDLKEIIKRILKTCYILVLAAALVMFGIFLGNSKHDSEKFKDLQTAGKVIDQKELDCMTEAIWYEARGEGTQGMQAVAGVILNRTKSKQYPDSVCAVVHQPKQFSYRNHVLPAQPVRIVYNQSEAEAYTQARKVSIDALTGRLEQLFDNSVLWYAKANVSNYWTKKKAAVMQIGQHIFYSKQQKI
jgi:spore germination cell wall hydrolase CwlJ-like protein